MIVVGVYTCGRRAYLEETLASLAERVDGPVTRVVFFDDSGDPAFRAWLEDLVDVFPGTGPASVASWGRNRGFTESVARSWEWLGGHAVEPYVFHLEEDFVFDRPIHLDELIHVLEDDERLDQVALLRGPYFPRELRAGSIIAEHPEAYERCESTLALPYLAHDLVFTTNPSIYRRDLCAEGWPRQARSERLFTRARAKAGRKFAYIGAGTPWVSHIGTERAGVGGY